MAVLDTHSIVKRLTDAGFTESQAETFTDVLRQTRELDLSHLVTRDYLDSRLIELEAKLGTELAELETKLRTEIGGVRIEMTRLTADLLKWLAPLLLGQALSLPLLCGCCDLRSSAAEFDNAQTKGFLLTLNSPGPSPAWPRCGPRSGPQCRPHPGA
jgi:hypothetical protein